jgi:hypothetical protein
MRLPILLLLASRARARHLNVLCQHDVRQDTPAILSTILGSLKGDVIQIQGTCVVNQTIPLLEGRGFVGVDKNSSRIVQADGANLPALAASEAWLNGAVAPGSATRIAHLTLDGNSQKNSGTHTLVLRAWLLNVYDLNVLNSAEDGIHVTSFSADTRSANQATQSQVNNVASCARPCADPLAHPLQRMLRGRLLYCLQRRLLHCLRGRLLQTLDTAGPHVLHERPELG